MKKISLSILALSSALLATPEVTTLTEVFSEAKTSGNVKYYFIQTDKNKANAADTSANANTIGGQLSFDTASFYGVSGGITFMTTNPFLLRSNDSKVDSSIIGRDNGVRALATGSTVTQANQIKTEGFSVLGEAYLAYNYKGFGALIGREVIKTPLIDAKEVRLLPSAVEGGSLRYKLGKTTKFDLSYYSGFKQRTSDEFINITRHALGNKTETITGSSRGYVGVVSVEHKTDNFSLKAYDYYADDFINSLYLDGSYKFKTSSLAFSLAAQYINQTSIGHADNYLGDNTSVAGGSISSNAMGLKGSMKVSSAKFVLAYSKVFRNSGKHDSLVLPWDGTPLFTNMITSNDLFISNYGQALASDSVYIGGSQGIKFAYNQQFGAGFSSTLAYLNTSNSREGFDKNQNDYNIVLQYKAPKAFTLQLKGIWVENNTGASADGRVAQLKLLSQYRVIANYKF